MPSSFKQYAIQLNTTDSLKSNVCKLFIAPIFGGIERIWLTPKLKQDVKQWIDWSGVGRARMPMEYTPSSFD